MPERDRTPSSALGNEGAATSKGAFVDSAFSFRGAPLDDSYSLYAHLRQYRAEKAAVFEKAKAYLKVTRKEYNDLSAVERRQFDEGRLRLASYEVVVPTQNVDSVLAATRRLLRVAEFSNRDQQKGLVVQGAAGIGKTTALLNTFNQLAGDYFDKNEAAGWWHKPPQALLRESVNAHGDRVTAPAIFAVPIILTSKPTPRSIAEDLLISLSTSTADFSSGDQVGRIGAPGSGAYKPERLAGSERALTKTLVERLTTHGVRLVVIDEIHFVRGDSAGDQVVNYLKSLIDRTRVVLLMAGVTGADGLEFILRKEAKNPTIAQLRRRLVVLDFKPFEMNEPDADGNIVPDPEWSKVVGLMAAKLILLDQDPKWWLESSTLEYLWKRTQGVFTSLSSLLMEAAHVAIGKTEKIDLRDLERIRISEEADWLAARQYRLGPKYRPNTGKEYNSRKSSAKGVSKKGEKVASDLVRSGVVASKFAADPESGFGG